MTAVPLPPSAQHWYRQKWPWLLIAGPALVVLASLATLWIAAATDDGVISDDYYKRGLLINRELARSARAESMHVGALLRVAPDGAASVALSGFADAAAAPAYVRVHLAHPTRAGQDRIVTLTRGPRGRIRGRHRSASGGPLAGQPSKRMTGGFLRSPSPTGSPRCGCGTSRSLRVIGPTQRRRRRNGNRGECDADVRQFGAASDVGDLAGVSRRGRGRGALLHRVRPVRPAFLRRAARACRAPRSTRWDFSASGGSASPPPR